MPLLPTIIWPTTFSFPCLHYNLQFSLHFDTLLPKFSSRSLPLSFHIRSITTLSETRTQTANHNIANKHRLNHKQIEHPHQQFNHPIHPTPHPFSKTNRIPRRTHRVPTKTAANLLHTILLTNLTRQLQPKHPNCQNERIHLSTQLTIETTLITIKWLQMYPALI